MPENSPDIGVNGIHRSLFMPFEKPTQAKLKVSHLTFHIVNMLTSLDGTTQGNLPKVREALEELEKAYEDVAKGL